MVSLNLFSLLCDGTKPVTTASMVSITKFGGPILYLVIYSCILFAVLVWFDSGSNLPRKARRVGDQHGENYVRGSGEANDVLLEADDVSRSNDPLRVMNVTKAFRGSDSKAVENVSFGVSHDTIMALLGPNGAGKTTIINIIRKCPLSPA